MAIREIGIFQQASEREDGIFFHTKNPEYNKRIEDIYMCVYIHIQKENDT